MDRRFHAQPTCCSDCGPGILSMPGETVEESLTISPLESLGGREGKGEGGE